jgi:hypothetical protein
VRIVQDQLEERGHSAAESDGGLRHPAILERQRYLAADAAA